MLPKRPAGCLGSALKRPLCPSPAAHRPARQGARHADRPGGGASLAGSGPDPQEVREYYRRTAWELPALARFSAKYEPPRREDILRFRYTAYLGEEHPAASKVAVEVLLDSLALSPAERHKLVVLAGPRYSPATGVLKLSCELFPDRGQNKRYLSQQLRRLVQEAKNPRDTFQDIPQDLRHVRPKTRLAFPREWAKP